jgi:O-antigen/teichoic acid export membrane protein
MTHSSILAPKDSLSAHSTRRYRRILAAALSAFFGKGIGLLVSVITVPLTVRYLGAESYGLWITISSTVMMFFVLDLGVASTLTNLISEAYVADDKRQAAVYFATAFWVIAAVVSFLGLVGWLAWPHIHWAFLFHLQGSALTHSASEAVATAFVVFLFALPTSLAVRVLGGYQELHAANFFATGGSILSLAAVVAVVHFHGSLPVLVGAYAGSAVTANAACLLWICLLRKPWMKPWPNLVDARVIGRIFHSGIQFFLIQVAGLAVFNSDNLVIAHYLSPAQVTPYSVTWRFVGYLTAIQGLVIPSLWPAFSESWSRGNIAWIRMTYNRLRWGTAGILALGSAIFLFFGRTIIRLWAGSAAVPSPWLLRLMCIWMIICAVTVNQSCLMGATNRVKKQAIASFLAAVANLALSIFWVRTMGPIGVLLATILTYVVFIVFVQAWEVRSILRTKPSVTGYNSPPWGEGREG